MSVGKWRGRLLRGDGFSEDEFGRWEWPKEENVNVAAGASLGLWPITNSNMEKSKLWRHHKQASLVWGAVPAVFSKHEDDSRNKTPLVRETMKNFKIYFVYKRSIAKAKQLILENHLSNIAVHNKWIMRVNY